MTLCTSKCASDSLKNLSEAKENCNHLKRDMRGYDWLRPEFQCWSLIQCFRWGQTQPRLLDMFEQHGRSYPLIPDDTKTQQNLCFMNMCSVFLFFWLFVNSFADFMRNKQHNYCNVLIQGWTACQCSIAHRKLGFLKVPNFELLNLWYLDDIIQTLAAQWGAKTERRFESCRGRKLSKKKPEMYRSLFLH